MKSKFIATITSVILLGCASSADVEDDQRNLSKAKSCCSTMASLPTSLPQAAAHEFRLSPESPHFDFGEGLAPFVFVSVDSTKAPFVEVVSTLQQIGLPVRGMFHFRGIVPTFIFLSANGDRLQTSPASEPAPVLAGWSGQYSLSTRIAVPPGARTLVVATRMSVVDSRNSGCVRPGGSGRPVAYDRCITYPAGVLQTEDWRGGVYGNGKLLQTNVAR